MSRTEPPSATGPENTPKPQSFTMSLMSLISKPKRRSGLSEPKRSMASRQGIRRKGVCTSTSSTSLNTRFRKPSWISITSSSLTKDISRSIWVNSG